MPRPIAVEASGDNVIDHIFALISEGDEMLRGTLQAPRLPHCDPVLLRERFDVAVPHWQLTIVTLVALPLRGDSSMVPCH